MNLLAMYFLKILIIIIFTFALFTNKRHRERCDSHDPFSLLRWKRRGDTVWKRCTRV